MQLSVGKILFAASLCAIAAISFLAVLYYDRPVHPWLATRVQRVCIDGVTARFADQAPDAKTRDELKITMRPIIARFCGCYLPTAENRKSYLSLAQAYLDGIARATGRAGPDAAARTFRGCYKNFLSDVETQAPSLTGNQWYSEED